jgi:hypothetical protein
MIRGIYLMIFQRFSIPAAVARSPAKGPRGALRARLARALRAPAGHAYRAGLQSRGQLDSASER